MRKIVVFITLVVMLISTGVMVVGAQDDASSVLRGACPFKDGAFYQANLFPRYEFRNQRLVMVSWNTGKTVQEVETSLETAQLNIMNWSPDCRYMAAALGEFGKTQTVVWDMTNGQRMGSFLNAGLRWSPDSQQAIVSNRDGLALWTVGQELAVKLSDFRGDDFISRWDADHNEVWLLPTSYYYSAPGVTVYNRANGEQVGYYDNPAGESAQIGFTLSADGSRVIVYTVRLAATSGAGVTVWERGTGNNVQVDANSDGTSYAERIALSPDAHYLVIGGNNLRVWDLQNLPAALNDRDPVIYAASDARITSVRFLNGSTVEAVSTEGIAQWDVVSGNIITNVASR
ncbi:MAG: WD40 repeat domain-containing protein [Chloroflexi bacterium]|nr:WD40 repeat domain-containing protein [Chloroflexota bacterium]MCC6896272.1 WD40 repeat domain-containing protein [Anaerolineae bacterium]